MLRARRLRALIARVRGTARVLHARIIVRKLLIEFTQDEPMRNNRYAIVKFIT